MPILQDKKSQRRAFAFERFANAKSDRAIGQEASEQNFFILQDGHGVNL